MGGADFQFVGHCPTYISWAIALLPSRGPLPYYHSFRGPLPYFCVIVGHCPTSISWAVALLPFISWAIALLLCYRGPLPYFHLVGRCPTTIHFVGHCPTSVLSWAIALLLRTLILVFVCCKTRLVIFVLRGCDSISLVPYVPGPILATICRSESQLTRVSSSTC